MKFVIACLILLGGLMELGANALLDKYRENGLEAIKKDLDLALTKRSYWLEVMRRNDVRFGYLQGYSSLLVCDKNSSILRLYQKDSNASFILKSEYLAFTGKNRGDKHYEGDLKTPVGIYTITKKLSSVDPFYGPLAFVTSYPNLFDRYRKKKGHGIWIHGLPINQKRERYTKGCIAINNEGLECLSRDIKLSETVLLIFENLTPANTKARIEELATLGAWLYKWRYAWKYNDIKRYLSFYSKDFKRADGVGLEAFSRYKRAIFGKKEQKRILFNDINIIPYPNHPGIYQITFFERYATKSYRYEGKKELLVRQEGSSYRIIVEK